ncbi:diacylglycerol/lipid kinase family protein [Rhodoluna lacicola]|uniref:diacylglycerol/lipid kinase family protein n=1 Tax=Rhodoluna lacicola TaxID=529884 RepID=UPI0022303B6C|nr:diacylglycerol kinase family protein [Rhodoluna lacicola]
MRLGVIINPAAGNGAGRLDGEKVISELQRESEVLDLTGSSMQDSEARARDAVADNLIDGLVVVGGDGMAHLGVNLCAEAQIPLGIVAAGTGNDAARALGLPIGDAVAGVRVIINNLRQPRNVDLVRASSSIGEFWYFGSLSVDFVALVNQRANIWKWPKGPSRYKWAMIAELASFKPINYKAVIDGEEKEFQAMLCSVGNSPFFGGGMKIAPHSKIDDGKLDIFIVNKISRFELLKVFPRVYTGDHVTHPAVEFISATEVQLSSNIKMPAYSDGEPVGFAPITAKIAPGALRVYATSARQSSVA